MEMTCTTAWIRKMKLYGARSLTLTRLNVFHLNLSHLKFFHPNSIPHLQLITRIRLSPLVKSLLNPIPHLLLVDSYIKSLLNPIPHLHLVDSDIKSLLNPIPPPPLADSDIKSPLNLIPDLHLVPLVYRVDDHSPASIRFPQIPLIPRLILPKLVDKSPSSN